MQTECSFPAATSYSPAVLGPFTAVECLTLTACLPLDFLVYEISHIAACIVAPLLQAASLVLVIHERRGEHPFELFSAFLEYRLVGRNPKREIGRSIRSVDTTMSVYRLDNVNYACALKAEKETFLDSFLSFCLSARGCIRFLAIPVIDDGVSGDMNTQPSGSETAGLRSFYLSAREGQAPPAFIGGTASDTTPLCDPSSVHPLVDSRLLQRVMQ